MNNFGLINMFFIIACTILASGNDGWIQGLNQAAVIINSISLMKNWR